MRTTIKNMVQAIADAVAVCVPDAEHYMGRLEEPISRPAFLYVPTYFGEKKANYFTSTRNVEIQIIYFGRTDGSGNEDFMERLDTEAKLESFLVQQFIPVDERYLHFDYEVKEADKQMAIYLTFQFLDEALDQAFIEREKAELAGSIKVEMVGKAKAD